VRGVPGNRHSYRDMGERVKGGAGGGKQGAGGQCF